MALVCFRDTESRAVRDSLEHGLLRQDRADSGALGSALGSSHTRWPTQRTGSSWECELHGC